MSTLSSPRSNNSDQTVPAFLFASLAEAERNVSLAEDNLARLQATADLKRRRLEALQQAVKILKAAPID